jgi:hypothetical protein
VQEGDCGDLAQCLGEALPASEQLQCSIRMQAADDFQEITLLEMTGSVTCPTVEVCEEVRGRVADADERLWMCSPSWVDEGNECARRTDG